VSIKVGNKVGREGSGSNGKTEIELPLLGSLIPIERRKLKVISFDPGETTGACFMHGPKLIDARQLATGNIHDPDTIVRLRDYIEKFPADVLVYEDYRVYAWESEKHKWATLHTPKLIGIIVTLGYLACVPVRTRMAQEAKGFSTDDKLACWGLKSKGARHANDAVRHAVYELVFGKPL
jgi:hypothetical protein